MNRRVSIALALWSLSMAAQAVVPTGGRDEFDSLATSQGNWKTATPGAPLSVGNGQLEFSSGINPVQQVGGWQWNRYANIDSDWSFETTISLPSGLVTGS